MTLSLSPVRILIAESEVELAERLQHLLEEMKAEIAWETNGSRATDRALNEKFDLLILAIDLPILGGAEVLRFCRQRRISCPAIALVDDDDSLSEETLKELGFAAGIDRQIVEVEQLEAVLRSALPESILTTKE